MRSGREACAAARGMMHQHQPWMVKKCKQCAILHPGTLVLSLRCAAVRAARLGRQLPCNFLMHEVCQAVLHVGCLADSAGDVCSCCTAVKRLSGGPGCQRRFGGCQRHCHHCSAERRSCCRCHGLLGAAAALSATFASAAAAAGALQLAPAAGT